MRTDEERDHDDQHRVYEHVIRMELARGFPNDPDCQTAVLLELLAELLAGQALAASQAEVVRLREEVQSLTDELAYHGVYPK